MSTLESKVKDFLAHKRIAVAGVSRNKPGAASLIYHKLKEAGDQVFAQPQCFELRGRRVLSRHKINSGPR